MQNKFNIALEMLILLFFKNKLSLYDTINHFGFCV